MGGQQSLSQDQIGQLESAFLKDLPKEYMPVGIDGSILKYSGMRSTAMLNAYSSDLLSELQGPVPDYLERVGDALGGLTAVPHAVGMGALVISMILQVAFTATKSPSSDTEGPGDMLRRIFAEEKAFGVRDLMEESLKRHRMYLRNDQQLLEDIKHLERDLSKQLTVLKNFMLVDGHMNSQILNHWVNGAAFHAQMLIHMARLQRKDPQMFEGGKSAASSAIDTYSNDILDLLKIYKEYKASTFSMIPNLMVCGEIGKRYCNTMRCFFKDVDTAEYSLDAHFCKPSRSTYIEYIFSNHSQIIEFKTYFSELQKNIDDLCKEEGTFELKT